MYDELVVPEAEAATGKPAWCVSAKTIDFNLIFSKIDSVSFFGETQNTPTRLEHGKEAFIPWWCVWW